MQKHFHRLLFSFILVLLSAGIVFAMPPHPDLLEQIKRGEIEKPYYIEHYKELIAKGVNSPKGVTPPAMVDENFNILVLLVDFSDHLAQTSDTFFDTLVFVSQFGTVVDYFADVTYGDWTIVTPDPPGNTGWYRSVQSYAYYTDGQGGLGDYPQNSQGLVEDLVEMVDFEIDFSEYDNDGNYIVEGLIVVHAGTGGEYSGSDDDIWSHQWNTEIPIMVDSVYVFLYSIVPELWVDPGDMTCGVYAHEAGHAVFDLPDLYDTDESSQGLGAWSLMAGGSWNGTNGDSPAHPDAWCKIRMGVITPTVVTHNLIGEEIDPVAAYPTVYKLPMNGTIISEYFLVENRQPIGYDAELPGDGLLIYHISDTVSTGNDNEWFPGHINDGHYLVALEQADGQWDLEQNENDGDDGDPFPGVTNNTTFDSLSAPDSKGYNFVNSGVAVTNISPSSTYMTADLIVETDYPEHVVSSDFWETNAVYAADVDSDGDMDILAAAEDAMSDISWWENDGNQNFTEHSITDSIGGADDVYATDLDSDGNMDVLGASRDANCIRWWENNGNQNFTEHSIAEEIWDVNSVYAADVDGDLDIDVLGASDQSYDSRIAWWENDGSENFTEHIIALQDYAFLDVLSYDLDSDGDMDVLGCGYNLTWWENNGNQNFTEHIIDEYYWAYSIDVANVDGDGDFDILAALEDEDRIAWWENDGNQNFTEHVISDSFDGANHVYAIDIDDDYDLDVLGAAINDNMISLWNNDGNQNFSEQVISSSFEDARSVHAADMDSDGDFDIVGGAENYFNSESNISWWEQVGDPGAFVENPIIAEVPRRFTIHSPYPNPFNPCTVISFELRDASFVELTVYDIAGREVARLVEGWRSAGIHQLTFDGSRLSSGIYFARLQADGFSRTRKLLLIK